VVAREEAGVNPTPTLTLTPTLDLYSFDALSGPDTIPYLPR
jgi:hypothetical protein